MSLASETFGRKILKVLYWKWTASFWRDSWSPFGPLFSFLGANGPRNLRIPIDTVVAEAVEGNTWILASQRSQSALDLQIF